MSSFEHEQELTRQIREAEEQRRAAAIALAGEQASELWQAGERGRAMVILFNCGLSDRDLLDFARWRGLTEDEARQVVRDAPIDRG